MNKLLKKGLTVLALIGMLASLSACSFTDLLENIVNNLESMEEAASGSEEQGEMGDPGNVTEKLDANTEKLSHYDSQGRLVFYHITKYNEQGQVINKSCYMASGALDSSYDFTYTADGQALDGAWFFWDSGYLMKTERKYNENGQLTETWNHGSKAHNVVGNKCIYQYDEQGRAALRLYYSTWREDGSHGEPVYQYRTFDERGNYIHIDIKNEAGDLLSSEDYTYDANDHRTSYTAYKQDGSIDYRYLYYYDENGKRTKEERYNGKGELVSVDTY